MDYNKTEKLIQDVERWYYKTYKKELDWYYGDPYEVYYSLDKFFKKLKELKYPKAIKIEHLVDPNFFKDLGLDNKNIVAALNSGNEVMISGEYYAVKVYSDVAEILLKSLKLQS